MTTAFGRTHGDSFKNAVRIGARIEALITLNNIHYLSFYDGIMQFFADIPTTAVAAPTASDQMKADVELGYTTMQARSSYDEESQRLLDPSNQAREQPVISLLDNADEEEQVIRCCGATRLIFKRKDKAAVVSYAFVFALLFCALFVFIYLYTQTRIHSRPRNVILLISDGFGYGLSFIQHRPASEVLARNYYTHVNNLPFDHQLPLDTILVGASRTRSWSSLITDSAAGATAFSCILKTYNGAIGVDSNRKACGTILEAAKSAGYRTGLVATSRITHATPASFAAHVVDRDMEDIIARQLIGDYALGRNVDLMFGGGLCHFLARDMSGSCRADYTSPFDDARTMGWDFASGMKSFNSLQNDSTGFPVARLFALNHMPYNIDRNPDFEPSLADMAFKAMGMLSTNNDKGFFLMVEGSRIDMAAHSNDPATHVHEILAYQDTVEVVKRFVDSHPDTVMISVSDHETGGLAVGRQVYNDYPEYQWYPEALAKVTKSSEYLAQAIKSFPASENITAFIMHDILEKGLGITNYVLEDVAFLSARSRTASALTDYLSKLTSLRAQVGWSTHGHSAVDVNLYAYGTQASPLAGNHENTDIGAFIRDFMVLDIAAITHRLENFIPSR